jgi:membrane protease YdiL (CAAX protease family)
VETSIWVFIVGAVAMAILLCSGLWRLRRGVRLGWRGTPQAGIGAAVLLLFGGIFGGVIGGLVAAAKVDVDASLADQLIVMCGVWGGQALVLGGFLYWRIICPRKPSIGAHGRMPLHQAMFMGVLGLAVFWPITVAVSALGAMVQEAITGTLPSALAHGLLPDLLAAGPSSVAWAMVLAVIVGPSLFEEIMYRGLLQESLRRLSSGRPHAAWAAVVATSLVFTLMHTAVVSPHALPGLFVLSLGFGWVVARTGRLAAGVTMHLLFNAGNLLIAVPWITS